MFKRIIGYFKTMFGMKAEAMMDPEVQIEQALREAQEQDRDLRTQAAQVIAHRSEVQMKLDQVVELAAKAKQNATLALQKAKTAQEAGKAEELDKWMRTAQSLAVELETQERLVDGLKAQFETAEGQAELAKKQVSDNALRLKQLSAKRMELVGKLQQAKMQENVNKTLEKLNRPMESDGPSFTEIEDKINKRMASASAKAELESDSIEGAQRELEAASVDLAGNARLDALKAELGMVEETPPAATTSTEIVEVAEENPLAALSESVEAESVPVPVESEKQS